MKNYFLLVLLAAFQLVIGQKTEKYTLSGTIKDDFAKETLMGVNILVAGESKGTTTNEYGFYSMELPKGNYKIQYSYLGFKTIVQEINLNSNIKNDIIMSEDNSNLEEVVIVQNKNTTSLKKPEVSLLKLDQQIIEKTPSVLGEPDVLKVIQQFPGVTTNGEGASGFNVRGGAVDQNLVILDEATLFNTSHLFGFFSVFNSDAIKDIRLYKGGIPSKYGGRVSSVLDIYQREGNKNQFKLEGGIGVLSSKLLAEGPLKKDKGSFLVAGRGSYAHLFLKAADNNNSASFFDINSKLSWEFNDRSTLYFSNYIGKDYFSLGNIFNNEYGNNLVNARWNYIFNDKLFSNLSAVYSRYDYGLEEEIGNFRWKSSIDNSNLKYDFKYYKNENIVLNFGVQSHQYWFNPGEIIPSDTNSGANYKKLEVRKVIENAGYIEAEHKINDKLTFQYGTRISAYSRIGAQTYNTYLNDNPVVYNSEFDFYEKATPIGTKKYGKNEVIKSYFHLEPRFSLNYNWNENAIKFSYNRMAQYIHMLSNTLSPTPLDIWTPSDQYIKPQILDQFVVGYFKDFSDKKYSIESEVYYKDVSNRINYIDGADLIANEAVEQIILNGEERAYGLELLLRKNNGKFKGWISYTLSKAEQRTPGRNANEPGINNGEWYRANHDRTHNLATTFNYELNPKWSLGANFNFQTGRAVTYPEGYFEYLDINIPVFNERNSASLPAYHRLDVSATYTPKVNENRKFKSEWNFSIYNIYNRQNANSMTFRQNDEGKNESVQLSIFGMVPSVTYSFKF